MQLLLCRRGVQAQQNKVVGIQQAMDGLALNRRNPHIWALCAQMLDHTINIHTEQGRAQGVTLQHPHPCGDRLREATTCAETDMGIVIHALQQLHVLCAETQLPQACKQHATWYRVKRLAEVHKHRM
jgi:hypothetical protein